MKTKTTLSKLRRSALATTAALLTLVAVPAMAAAGTVKPLGLGGTHAVQTFHDASGKVTVTVFEADGNPLQGTWIDQQLAVPDPAMVAIGGGGTATDQGAGAFLTASHPNGDLSGWVVSAKDHLESQAYSLKVYVIGLKIAGMSREQLLDPTAGWVQVSHDISVTAPHPESQTAVDSNQYALVGGGFKVNYHGAGNMGTASFPYGGSDLSPTTTWKVKSQDNQVSDPASIETWAIGLKLNLPVGHVVNKIVSLRSGQAQHPNAEITLPSGFALTGGGAEVHTSGWGNLLWNLQPSAELNPSFTAGSADHIRADPSTLDVFALGIRIA